MFVFYNSITVERLTNLNVKQAEWRVLTIRVHVIRKPTFGGFEVYPYPAEFDAIISSPVLQVLKGYIKEYITWLRIYK